MKIKKLFIRVLFGIELLVLAGFYVLSPHGLPGLLKAQQENTSLQEYVSDLKMEVAALEQEVELFVSDSFYAEKIAREQLQMAKAGDEVYYI